MTGLRFVDLIPAENPAHLRKGVNILLMVENSGEEVTAAVRFYGSDGASWREMYAQEYTFPGHTHIHAYFHLPSDCFHPEKWGEEPEELSIWAGLAQPSPAQQGYLLFLEP